MNEGYWYDDGRGNYGSIMIGEMVMTDNGIVSRVQRFDRENVYLEDGSIHALWECKYMTPTDIAKWKVENEL